MLGGVQNGMRPKLRSRRLADGPATPLETVRKSYAPRLITASAYLRASVTRRILPSSRTSPPKLLRAAVELEIAEAAMRDNAKPANS